MQLLIYTNIALLFLSANSILARMAMVTQNIDAFTFTAIRILSGAILLLLIYFYKHKHLKFDMKKNWLSSFMLFLYAICFSYSYINMEAGIGTLILFAVVQLSMIFIAVFLKESLTINKLLGILIAFSGLFYLLYPRDEFTISYVHTLLMIVAGIAWGVYTVLGKSSKNATLNTTDNFFKASIFTILFMIFFIGDFKFDSFTVSLALISGAITSALGYLIWYYVLPQMQILTASILQLLVPIIAIVLSIIFLNEQLTYQLVISTIVILIGILVALKKKKNLN